MVSAETVEEPSPGEKRACPIFRANSRDVPISEANSNGDGKRDRHHFSPRIGFSVVWSRRISCPSQSAAAKGEKWRQSRFSSHPQPRQGRPTRQPPARPRPLALRRLSVRRCGQALSGPAPGLPGEAGTMVAERPSRIRRSFKYVRLRAGKPFIQPRTRSVVRATTSRLGKPVLRPLTPGPVPGEAVIRWLGPAPPAPRFPAHPRPRGGGSDDCAADEGRGLGRVWVGRH